MLYDYGYRVPEAITIYKRFRDQDKIKIVAAVGNRGHRGPITYCQQGQDGDHFGLAVRPFVRSSKDTLQFCLQHRLFNQRSSGAHLLVRKGLEKERQMERSQRSRQETQTGLLLHVRFSVFQRPNKGNQRSGGVAWEWKSVKIRTSL